MKIKNIGVNGEVEDLSNLPKQNEILFVLDSVGWTEFNKARASNIKSLKHVRKAYSHSYYTPPSIEAMFRGAVPQPENKCFWPYGRYSTAGENVVIPTTMQNLGYHTYLLSSNLLISTERTVAGSDVISCHEGMFENCFTNDTQKMSAGSLIDWFLSHFEEPFFAFFLVIETHTPYLGKDKEQETQIKAIELVDKEIGRLKKIKTELDTRLIVTSDHSEAWSDNNKRNQGHNPRKYYQYIRDGRMKRLTEVFLASGVL